MTDCILATPGTIGYIDSGHGHSVGLEEIELENLAGTTLNSRIAKERNGIDAPRSAFPESTTDDFGSVTLVNGAGTNTWPIVQMTYIYVRKNITYIEDPEEQALLIAFLRALQDDAYIGECKERYGFSLPSEDIRAFAKTGIDLLESGLREGAPTFLFESDTAPIEGAGEFVISQKRQDISVVERASLELAIEVLQDQVRELGNALETAQSSHPLSASNSGGGAEQYQDTEIMAALVLASLSFVFWMLYFAAALCRWCRGKGGGRDTATSAPETVVA